MLNVSDIAEDQIMLLYCVSGEEVIIDEEDYDILNQYTWYFNRQTGYVTTAIGRRTIQIGRLILRCHIPYLYVDHRNQNKLDCRKINLRKLSSAKSAVNRRKYRNARTSKFKGVYWHKQKEQWYARLYVRGKTRSLGLWNSERLASIAYQKEAIKLHGKDLVCF